MTARLVEHVGDATFHIGDYPSEGLAVLVLADTCAADDSEHDLTIEADEKVPVGRRATQTNRGA